MEREASGRQSIINRTSRDRLEPLSELNPLSTQSQVIPHVQQDADDILETMTVPERNNQQKLAPLEQRPHTDNAQSPADNTSKVGDTSGEGDTSETGNISGAGDTSGTGGTSNAGDTSGAGNTSATEVIVVEPPVAETEADAEADTEGPGGL